MPSLQTAAFLKQLGMLVKAGVPLHQGLSHLIPSQAKNLQPLSKALVAELEAGKSLSEACRLHHKGRFNETQLACIEAAEESGQLESILGALAQEEESDYQLQQKLMTRLAYPVVLIHAAALIPSFITFVQQSFLLAALETALWLSPFYVIGISLYVLTRDGSLDAFLLRVPFYGNYLRCSGASRFCRNLAALLRSGTRVEKAYLTASGATGNTHMTSRLVAQVSALEQGESISTILKRADVFPQASINLLAAGDVSGTLDQTLDYLAEQLRMEAVTSSDRLGLFLPGISYAIAVFMIVCRIFQILSPLFKTFSDIEKMTQ